MYIAYARKSTEDSNKQVQSIDDQLKWINACAKKHWVKISKTFIDRKSWKTPRIRDWFNEMTDFIANNKWKKITILSWKLNRISRNPIDWWAIQYMLSQNEIKIETSDWSYDRNTNQILLWVMFWEASQFSIDLSKNVTRWMMSKVDRGLYPWASPVWYLNDRFSKQWERKILVGDENFAKLQELWSLLLTWGYALFELYQKANEQWLKNRYWRKVSRSAFYSIFNNPFYYWEFTWWWSVYKWQHKPMVSRDDFDRAQVILWREWRAKPQKRLFTYAWMIKCWECGFSVIAEPPKSKLIKKNNTLKIYNYVRCSKKSRACKCKQKSILRENLNDQLLELADSLHIPQSIVDWLFKELEVKFKDWEQDLITRRKQIQREYNENEWMIEESAKKNIKWVINDDTYKSLITEFESKRERLRRELDKYDGNKDNWLDEVKATFDFARYVKEAFNWDDEKKKKIVLSRLGSNFYLKDWKFTCELHYPLRKIQEICLQSSLANLRLEPMKHRLDKVKTSPWELVNPVWYNQQDSNLRP